MLFCITATYTTQAVNALMDNPTASRVEAVSRLIEAAGGKLHNLYSTASDGPGVLAIFEVPDAISAPAIAGVVVGGGAVHNLKLTRLITPEEVTGIRQKAAQLRAVYKTPGK
jgi:uncharacterized protein with GYD domain